MYSIEFEKLILGGMEEEEYQALLKEEANSDIFGQDYLDWCNALDDKQTMAEELEKMAEYYGQA